MLKMLESYLRELTLGLILCEGANPNSKFMQWS